MTLATDLRRLGAEKRMPSKLRGYCVPRRSNHRPGAWFARDLSKTRNPGTKVRRACNVSNRASLSYWSRPSQAENHAARCPKPSIRAMTI